MKHHFSSRVALADDAKHRLCSTLNVNLATAIDLQYQVKQAHWNIKGPQFFARHELFDGLADRLRGFVDEFAERVSTLGGYAGGTIRLAAQGSKVPEYDLEAVDGRRHIQALAAQYALYGKALRQGIEEAETHNDPVTADLYTEALRSAELDMWFLDSHLQT